MENYNSFNPSQNPLPAYDEGKPYSLWSITAILFSLIGTNIAVLAWIYLGYSIFFAYASWLIGLICILVALKYIYGKKKYKGKGLAKASLIISFIWILIFLTLHKDFDETYPPGLRGWGMPDELEQYMRSLPDYDPKLILEYDRGLYYRRKNLIHFKLFKYDGIPYAFIIPHYKKEKIRIVKLFVGPLVYMPEDEFKKALAKRDEKIRKAIEGMPKELHDKVIGHYNFIKELDEKIFNNK